MAQKNYVSLSKLSTFLDNLKTKFATISHKHSLGDITDYKVDTALSPTSTNPVQNKVLDAEFEAMATAMNALEQAIDGKSDSTHNHDDKYDAKGMAAASLISSKEYTNTQISGLASTTAVDNKISSHNTSTSAHNDIRELITGLTTRLNTLANSDDTTLDQMSEVVAYIKNNKNLIDGITTSKVNVADIVNNLTTNVANKPLSAAQGVVIKDLIDALQEELDSHVADTTAHMTSSQKAQLNTAYNHSQAAHAPSNAQPNQNAFSNVKVGSTTVAADTTTDTITFEGSNVTITPDATNDKITFAVADGTTSAKGVVQLTNSTSSTSTTTAATPNSVKSAYDLANQAKTAAATAQSTADSKVSTSDLNTTLGNYYTKAQINAMELITVADIDAICEQA